MHREGIWPLTGPDVAPAHSESRKELAMTIRRFAGAVGALLLTFGIGAIAPATGRAQTALSLPGEHSEVTLTGCFGWIHKQGYVLTQPTMGQNTVPQASCVVSEGDPMIKVRDDLKKNGLTKAMIGRYVIVSGTMGDEYPSHPDRLRKLEVESAAIPAIVPPPVAVVRETETIVQPAPVTPPAVMPEPVEQPVGTTGTMRKHLPKTATSLPLVGLIGLLSLGAGLTLHVFGRRSYERG
jgi:hypothetical protein